jgi:hypothetical protein
MKVPVPGGPNRRTPCKRHSVDDYNHDNNDDDDDSHGHDDNNISENDYDR